MSVQLRANEDSMNVKPNTVEIHRDVYTIFFVFSMFAALWETF